ncbi:MAG: FAD-binding oxidoreductase [Rhizobacter sp.]|nr:FAD-binding oxidoreductase [Rhizobacter sp.]
MAMSAASDSSGLLRTSRFVTFDGHVSISTRHQRPDRYRHLELALGRAPRIARGGGYSYSAASFGPDVIVQEMRAFDRLLDHDGGERLRVEAGATLLQCTQWARGRGMHLPVLPGYPLITVGGCIAADVHGKNPARDGTFSDWVEALTIYHPDRGYQQVSRADNAKTFAATCGGFGTTGVIVDATLRLQKLPAGCVTVEAHEVESLEQAAQWMARSANSDFVYSWHDGAGRGPRFGRGLVFAGRWSEGPPSSPARFRAMTANSRGALPIALWNRWTVAAANAIFQRRGAARVARSMSPFDAAFPFARQTLYHRLYGRPGLAEVQVLVPHTGIDGFVASLREVIHRNEAPTVMLSMKPFRGRQTSLSMAGEGVLVAVDVARTRSCAAFLDALDDLVIGHGAQPNVTKDSRLPRAVAARTLPSYEAFRAALRTIDPERLHRSELSERLGV